MLSCHLPSPEGNVSGVGRRKKPVGWLIMLMLPVGCWVCPPLKCMINPPKVKIRLSPELL